MSVGEFWPEIGVQKNEWNLLHRQNAPVSLSGDSVVTDFGEPYWAVDVSVEVPIRSTLDKQWSAFFRRREGMINTFTMNRSFRSFPLAGFNADPDLMSIDLNQRATGLIRVSGHGATQIEEGGMFSFYTAAEGYYIGEITNVSFNNTNLLQFLVSPPPFPEHETTPAIRLVKSVGEFRMDGPPSVTETHVSRGYSFTATQAIRG